MYTTLLNGGRQLQGLGVALALTRHSCTQGIIASDCWGFMTSDWKQEVDSEEEAGLKRYAV